MTVFSTSWAGLNASVDWDRPEVSTSTPNRRDEPKAVIGSRRALSELNSSLRPCLQNGASLDFRRRQRKLVQSSRRRTGRSGPPGSKCCVSRR